MKKLSVITLALSGSLLMVACNDNSADPVKSANESNEVKIDSAKNDNITGTSVSEDDSEFAVKAASGGMTEVQLGELAQQKSQNQRVKDFGAMMVRDHSKANDELKSLAGMKNITLPPAPGEDHMKDIGDLSKKTGKDFDKDFMKTMVDDHQETIDAFEKESKNGKDADIKAFVDKTLPTLKQHLDAAKEINNSLK